jgi:hypothetical protein
MRISRLFKRLRRWSSQAFRKRHSPAAFRTCRNAGNSVLTVEGTTSKGAGSISCEGELCIFYRLSLRTLRTKDVTVPHASYLTAAISWPKDTCFPANNRTVFNFRAQEFKKVNPRGFSYETYENVITICKLRNYSGLL